MKLPRLGVGARVAIGLSVFVLMILLVVAVGPNALKHPLERIASARLNRLVTIQGKLQVRAWSWSPTVVMEGLTVGNPPWAKSEPPLLKIERAEVQVQLLHLLRGELILPRVFLFQPQLYLHQDEQGQTNWSFENQQPSNAPARKPPKFPVIRDLLIEEGTLTVLDDSRHLQAKGEVQAHQSADDSDIHPFKLNVDGSINKSSFLLKAVGGPLMGLTPERPYSFELSIVAGENHIRSKGRVLRPFDLGGLDLDVDAKGEDLAELFYLTGFPELKRDGWHPSRLTRPICLATRRDFIGGDPLNPQNLESDSSLRGLPAEDDAPGVVPVWQRVACCIFLPNSGR